MSPSLAGAVGGRAPWRATALMVFPGMFPRPLEHSLAGRALEAGVWSLEAVDLRVHAGYKRASADGLAVGGKGNFACT